MKGLRDIYRASDYEVRLKARIFLPVLLLMILAFATNEIIQVFAGTLVRSDAVVVALVVVLLAALILLLRGRYRESSLTAALALAVAVNLIFWAVGYAGPQTFSENSALLTIVYLVVTVFVRERGWTLGIGVGSLAAFGVFLSVTIAGGKVDTAKVSLLDQTVQPVLILLFGIVLATLIQIIFSSVSGDLRSRLSEIREARRKSNSLIVRVAQQLDRSDELSKGTTSTAASSVQIEQNVGSIERRIVALRDMFADATAALAEVKTSLDLLRRHIDDQTRAIDQSAAVVGKMTSSISAAAGIIDAQRESVSGLAETARAGGSSMTEMESAFREVAAQIGSITKMTSLISDVAEQTNILSMNAAIEAARAGDSGRGFAVVASEIRSLARSSGSTAETIDRTLAEFAKALRSADQRVGATAKAFGSIEQEVRTVEESITEISRSAADMRARSSEILSVTEKVRASAGGIQGNVGEVAQAYARILAEIGQLADAVDEISRAMGEIAEGTTDIRTRVSDLQDVAVVLREQTALLQDAL